MPVNRQDQFFFYWAYIWQKHKWGWGTKQSVCLMCCLVCFAHSVCPSITWKFTIWSKLTLKSHILPIYRQHISKETQQKQYFTCRIQHQQTKKTKPTTKHRLKTTHQRSAATSRPGEGQPGVYRICICTLQHTGFLLLGYTNSHTCHFRGWHAWNSV